MEEVQYAIQKLKLGKAAGIDMICNEILKQPNFIEPGYALLKICFNIMCRTHLMGEIYY